MRPTTPTLALVVALAFGGAALAQQPSQGRAPPPPGYDGQQGGQEQAPPDLHRTLGIRPDQEDAYRAFMAATQPSQAEMERDRAEAQQMRSLRTPQRLDLIAGKMARDQAGFRAQADAVKRFYAALSPEQQRAFDQVTAPPPEDQQGGQDGPPEGYGQPPRR